MGVRGHGRGTTGPVERKSLDRIVAAALLGLAGVTLLGWIAAAPPGSSPDDDYHLASIWCAWGREQSGCRLLDQPRAPEPLAVDVDPLADRISHCYIARPDTSASCMAHPEGGVTSTAGETRYPSRADQGWYPGGYYRLMRLFVSRNADLSLLLVRAVSALIALGLMALAASRLRRLEGRRLLLYWLVAAVPVAAFLFSSSNPSGPAISGVAAGFVAFIAVVRAERGLTAWIASGVAALAFATACASRADAVYYCVLALVTGVLAAGGVPERRRGRTGLLAAPSIVVVGVALLLASQRDLSAADMLAVDSGRPGGKKLLATLPFVPLYYVGSVATRLGWGLETAMPPIVWGGAAVALYWVALGLRLPDKTRTASVVVLWAAMVAIPPYFLHRAQTDVFQWVQPRYLLPMVFMAVALPALDPGTLPRWRALLLVSIAVPVHAIALHVLMRRHITGLDVVSWDLSRGAEWWWDIPVSPNLTWAGASIAFAVLAVMLALGASPRADSMPSG